MRDPASPNGAETPETASLPGPSVVSIPDRRRIDSDVRAFLREPSTPWIVFDQEGRPPSQLAVGEMLPARSAILSEHGFFPATAAADALAAAYKQAEPSSLAVAADLTDDAAPDPDAPAIPMRRLSRRGLGAAAGLVAMVATIAIGAVALRAMSHDDDATAAAGTTNGVHATTALTARSFGAAAPTEALPPSIDVSAAAAKLTTNRTTPAAPSPDETPAKAQARKYGRLSVAGDARSLDVYMDGKRMLGRGARSFTVMCGPHTIAVGARTDVRDVEIPCTGTAELVITK